MPISKRIILDKIPLGLTAMVLLIVGCNDSKKESASRIEESIIIDEHAVTRLDSLLGGLVENGDVGGISALIYEKDKEVYYNAFGYADKDKDIPMARNTIVQIWSMTKPITGTALMTLYDQGQFELDDPLSKYAPEFSDMKVYAGMEESGKLILEEPKREISIRDLTRHTAGFGRNSNIEGIGPLIEKADALNGNNTLTEMAEKLGSLPLAFHPGEQWEYGPSVDVQAFLVERISGQPYREYLREHLLDPLGMDDTRYFVPESDRDRFSMMFRRDKDGFLTQLGDDSRIHNTQHWNLARGGWGLTSTLDDYMTFARMLVNKGTLDSITILKPETVELMATNHLDESIEERSFLADRGQVGFGIDFAVRLRPPATAEENNGVVGEFFWDGAASTLFWVDPTNKLTVVMLVQLFPYDQIGLHNKFRDAVYGPYDPPNEDVK